MVAGVDTERSEDAEDALCGLAASKELSGPLHAALVLALGKLGGRGGGRGLSGEAMDALRKVRRGDRG